MLVVSEKDTLTVEVTDPDMDGVSVAENVVVVVPEGLDVPESVPVTLVD